MGYVGNNAVQWVDPFGLKDGAAPSAMYHSHPPGFDPILSTYFGGDDSLTAGCMGFGSCQPVYMVCYTGQMQKLRPDATHRTIGWIR